MNRPAAIAVRVTLAAVVVIGVGVHAYRESTAPLPPGSAVLSVEKHVVGDTVWLEGSRSYLTVTAASGGTESSSYVGVENPVWSKRVRPGVYTIESHERQCSGNCDSLLSSTPSCRDTVHVVPGGTRVTVLLDERTGACKIELVLHG